MTLSAINSSPKYLLVDDEFATNKEAQKIFLKKFGLSTGDGIFAYNYQEALTKIKSALNIVVCFIDLIIPKNSGKYDYEQGDLIAENWLGLKLVSQIQKEKDIRIVIYSAQVPKDYLQRASEKYDNVTYCQKEINTEDLQRIKKLQLERIFKSNSSSKSSPIKKTFDYSSLDKETSSFVYSRSIEIKRLVKRTTEDIFIIGNNLVEVKEKLGYGNFQKWIEAEFGWTERTAQRFMLVAKNLDSDRLSGLNVLPSALYVMSAPSTPDSAVEELMEKARQGQIITEKFAKGITSIHKDLGEKINKYLDSEEGRKKYPRKVRKELEITQLEIKEKKETQEKSSKIITGDLERVEQSKQTILKVVSAKETLINTWWQLGENHQLFCGEPKSDDFSSKLSSGIALAINFPPNNDISLISSVKSESTLTLSFESHQIDLEGVVETVQKLMDVTTKPQETVVFCYLFDEKLLDVAADRGCHCIVAEPDLEKCDRILQHWREKDSVKKIIS
ncbi:MAG: DUF3102 domain-containing protein [Xenococcaceae cyanobacterium MO_188.B19]|nr:DUF3102 domain-containing protein [Xenococcaceae cyanobacterium MO_188.B19]